MLASGIPVKYSIPWANSATGGFIRTIPVGSQIGIQAGAASFTDGFPPATFTQVGAGGVPPFGQDFNGILQSLTQWAQWLQAGGPVAWDAAFSAAVGGYPRGAYVASAVTFGYFFQSTVDNNVTNPDAGGANWNMFSLQGTATTGDLKATFKTVADPGWVLMNDGTLGSATSNATTLAGATAQPLYNAIWTNVSSSFAPIFTAGGSLTTRGSSSAADFAASKALSLPLALGRAFVSAGAGSGLTALALGQTLGENNHILSITEMPSHTHGTIDPSHTHAFGQGTNVFFNQVGGLFTGTSSQLITPGATILPSPTGLSLQNTGGGATHNNMQPSVAVNWMCKL